MAVLLNNNGYGNQAWMEELPRLLPNDLPIYEYPDIPDKEDITYALVWDHPKGDLATYPNLKAVLSLGAGVEHLAEDNSLPDNLPIIRLVDPAVADDMAMHSLYWCMNFHRHYHIYQEQQIKKHWERYPCKPAEDFKVGILGLGNIGSVVGQKVGQNGYQTLGWDLSRKTIQDIETYHGLDQLTDFLENLDVLVNCLPLTSDTTNMIDGNFLSKMKQGSFLINISRGAIIKDQDLLSKLDEGHIAAAALDAFIEEPLPNDNPFWSHPKVHVTPHMSGATYARSAAKVLVNNINRLEKGKAAFPLYDRQKGF
ncbi:2-hydroxyacid dehydrogenase [Curvivirga aplysinae]|uniref:2-hydroxyacid dehydrogenase n=1 Tax=Curvivirga aplysinae TaxID=2529852 RepID=UPI0012BBC466|nr:glyoxylate/hydroxypyruvate reductase A [Curvivirga aplysinae]MTI09859.1 glyoxylate/hydroxypyruvate reductase A [Curvivirga aplysinae]